VPPRSESMLEPVCYFLLYAAALLTLWSMALYLKAAWSEMRGR
jgi:CDP-diacylglycerol--glycerol-3-phosphate 3-phosphatidyltransferase